jgi:hypothetical protein
VEEIEQQSKEMGVNFDDIVMVGGAGRGCGFMRRRFRV